MIKSIILIATICLSCNVAIAQEMIQEEDDFIAPVEQLKKQTNPQDQLLNQDTATPTDENTNTHILEEHAGKGDFYKKAQLNVIDKTLGKTYRITIDVGDVYTVGDLTIKPTSCWKPEYKGVLPESRSFIEITRNTGFRLENIFSGWMFAQAPALSHISHEKYDVFLTDCTM
jgi:hypothetical protein